LDPRPPGPEGDRRPLANLSNKDAPIQVASPKSVKRKAAPVFHCVNDVIMSLCDVAAGDIQDEWTIYATKLNEAGN
jgi:hypothetical protein